MAAPPFKVKALFKYDSGFEGDLNFPDGEILTVTAKEDADWYYGEYVDASGMKREGIFPMNFVDRYEPETPPRPARPSRPKKDTEFIHSPSINTEPPSAIAIGRQDSTEEPAKEPVPLKSTSQNARPGSDPGKAGQPLSPKSTVSTDLPQTSSDMQGGVLVNKGAPKLSAGTSKEVPPSTPADKAGGSSFRDRIAAFNKPTAPPIAPFKPGGLSSGSSGFIKKPFVAPPPSKNSYVPIPRDPPPPKVYRREEDPEITNRASQDDEHADKASPVIPAQNTGDNEDQPKPTSLKERIALLQKQQLEQAARHAEALLKKEKPKRPQKKRVESHEGAEDMADARGPDSENVDTAVTTGKRSLESSREETSGKSSTRRKPSREQSQTDIPITAVRGITSDADDADQSGAGEDAGETSTGRDDSDEQSKALAPGAKAPKPPGHGVDVGDNGNTEDEEEEEEEEEEIDPEVKRRMEIRERMAKMSGGMGMYGMFGPPGGVPPIPAGGAKKKKVGDKRGSGDPGDDTHVFAPALALPGMQPKPRSPEDLDTRLTVEKTDEIVSSPLDAERYKNGVPDTEDIRKDVPSIPPRLEERSPPPPSPQERPLPRPPPPTERVAPQPVPGERGAPPPPPAEARPPPPPTPTRPLSPSAGSESDDEMSLYTKGQSISTPTDSGPETRAPLPALRAGALPIPSRPDPGENAVSPEGKRASYFGANPTSPTSPTTPGVSKRQSRIPPIPMTSPDSSSASQARPPPPPPPSGAPPRRRSTADDKAMTPLTPKHTVPSESDEEVTEYEGDYDTDIAAGATHKDALKAHERESSYDDSAAEENSNRSPVIPPSNIPPPVPHTSAPRAVPPPPPSQPPKPNRQSVDMPRAAPPPIPSPREPQNIDKDDEYDPYRYTTSSQSGPVPAFLQASAAEPEDEDDLYSAPRPRQSQQSPPRQERPHPPPPSALTPSKAPTSTSGQSLEIQRAPTTVRRSMEQSRTSGERGYIASDIDLGESSYWWTQANTPPPALQNRRDILYEIEETSSSHGGKVTISKDVYVIFHDYSQTVITAEFDARNPADVVLRQRHQSPPSTLRQDQLEEAHTRFGQRISEAVAAKQNTIAGNGEPNALVLELLKQIPDVLHPVGVRAYGALVYANLANASFQQFDEIRAGDIITLRNAKFQGHRGPMHQKYNMEVGKPDHVGIVVDWDGTKKKVRAWEQGRESKKVKIESFKLGDLRSGEVKVWRIMGRSWVGWGGQS